MNRRILRLSAMAAVAVFVGISYSDNGAAAQTPPNPAAGGPGQAPGRRPGQGLQPGQGLRPGPGQNMGPGQRRGPGPRPGAGQSRGPFAGKTPPPGAPAAKTGVAVIPPSPPRIHHKGVDPFRIPWSVPAPPPYVFDDILPVRLADKDIEPPVVKPVTVREEPALRVSGIMTGDGVFAILEQSGDKVDIVKPGSSVDIGVSGGTRTYRVASIKDDTVTLESVEGNTTFQQVVPLSDAPIGTTSGSFGGGNTGPARGGFGPGSGGIPGGSRPGRGGPAGLGGTAK